MPSGSPAKDPGSPFIITVIEKAFMYGYSYDLMARLNFNDLLYLITNKDIERVNQAIDRLEKERQERSGVSIRKATPEEVAKMNE